MPEESAVTAAAVLVLLDHAPDGALRPAVPELVTLARDVAGPAGVAGVWVAGPDDEATVPTDALGVLGLDVVHRVRVDAEPHVAAVLADAVAAARESTGAALVLLVSTFENRDVAARLAVTLGAGVVTDADAVQIEDGTVVAAKTVLAGTWTTRCAVRTPLAVVCVKAGAVAAQEAARPTAPEVVEHALAVGAGARRVQVVERTEHGDSGRPDLASAQVVVVGGRGTEGDFAPLTELADLLGAAVGATRVATDEGWMDRDTQIGQTGVNVAPRLYIGAGVSGAVHHRGGMQAAGVIVAVNNDPDAPIFEIADYGVVGDLFAVLPQLTAELRRLRA